MPQSQSQSRTILSRLVGSYFRPPADLILENLPVGCPLILDPESINDQFGEDWDKNAIKVLLAPENFPTTITNDQLTGYGRTLEEYSFNLDPIHLGYIAKSNGKPAEGMPGNIEVLELMAACPNHTACLAFTPEGKPLVKISESPQ